MDENFDPEREMERAIDCAAGAFKLTSLLQKRIKALKRGSQRLVERHPGDQPFDTAFAEIIEGKITLKIDAKRLEGITSDRAE